MRRQLRQQKHALLTLLGLAAVSMGIIATTSLGLPARARAQEEFQLTPIVSKATRAATSSTTPRNPGRIHLGRTISKINR